MSKRISDKKMAEISPLCITEFEQELLQYLKAERLAFVEYRKLRLEEDYERSRI